MFSITRPNLFTHPSSVKQSCAITNHYRALTRIWNFINLIGGSRGRARRMPPPLRVQILLFWHTKFSKCNHLGRSMPPLRGRRLLWEILDPPLESGSITGTATLPHCMSFNPFCTWGPAQEVYILLL